MKNLYLVIPLNIILFSCKQTIDDKKKDIVENRIENAALRQEIKADSLKEQANRLQDEAELYQQRADKLKDSARNVGRNTNK